MIAKEGCLVGHAHVTSDLSRLGEVRQLVERLAKLACLDEDRAYDLKLAVSEACANAIEHPGCAGDIIISARLEDDRLLVEVRHPGEFRVRLRGSEATHRGMGLPLMVALMDEVRISSRNGGTNVTLSVRLR